VSDGAVGDIHPETTICGAIEGDIAVVIEVQKKTGTAFCDDLGRGKGSLNRVTNIDVVVVLAGRIALEFLNLFDFHRGAAAVEGVQDAFTRLEHGSVERAVACDVEVPREEKFI